MPVEVHGGRSLERYRDGELHDAARRRRTGELHHEERAALGRVTHPEAAAVEVDQLAGNVEPETGAAHLPCRAAVELMEALEDLAPSFRLDARTAVGDLELRRVGARRVPQLNADGAVGRRELERVREQVQQYLLEPGRIALRRYGVVGCPHREGDGAVECQRLEVVGDEAHQMAEIELGVVEVEFGRLDLGGLEEVVHVPEEHSRVPQNHFELVPVRIVSREVGQDPLGGGEDQRQRRPEFVADVGEEVRLEPVELLQARIEGRQFFVRLLQVPAEIRRLAGPPHDLGLHHIEPVGICWGGFLTFAPDVLRDVLDRVHD